MGVDAIIVQGLEAGGHVIGQVLVVVPVILFAKSLLECLFAEFRLL